MVPEGSPGLEESFPFKLSEPDEIPTRVKMPGAEDVSKATKADAKRDKRDSSGRRRGTASERDLADIGEQLDEKFSVIFGLASGLAPVTATYGIENSPKAINALLDIAKRRPAVLRALTTVADGANALEIGKFVLGILVCIQIDTGRIKGDELPARAFGATEIMERYFWEPEQETGMGNTRVGDSPNVTQMGVPNAVRFQPI